MSVQKKISRHIISVMMTVVMMIGLCAGFSIQEIKADSAFETSISGFPDSYKPYLRALHAKYPNWKFVPYNTGIKFSTAVNNESKYDRSLIENSFSKFLKSTATGDYNSKTGTYIAKDGASWVTASKNAVAYFMDPRNFLNEKHIYMFEKLSYDAANQTQAGVEAILDNTFMHNVNMGYITTGGKYKTTDTKYSAKIMEAAQKSKVSAYYLASKIIQEVGSAKHAKYAGMEPVAVSTANIPKNIPVFIIFIILEPTAAPIRFPTDLSGPVQGLHITDPGQDRENPLSEEHLILAKHILIADRIRHIIRGSM